MIPPSHFNQRYAGTTQNWLGTDSLEAWKKNCQQPESRAKLQRLGWLDRDPLTYKINSAGFRDDEFDQQPAVLALGCSHTQGIGVAVEHTWPRQLQNHLGLKVWNLGIGGGALDTCYRMLEYWIQHLNIKFVVCAVPEISRYEVFDSNWSNILPNMRIPEWLLGYQKNFLLYDQNSEMNRRKNLQAMQYICSQHNVRFYYDLLEDFVDGRDARDLMHYGALAQEKLATKFLQMMESQ